MVRALAVSNRDTNGRGIIDASIHDEIIRICLGKRLKLPVLYNDPMMGFAIMINNKP
ncbi:hypothetical protein USDA257_c39770 [Sinorhizobium fredii USDA 257]|uniref:Uncharacterized protein n=1 Tax=Sinorhizobium fredii (strain USDA 257) TaxID=1185652 RepID=I3X9G5_SINF2|nr:hypothetical protein USDA257_c39770 [Sinorhizobium fredii USDA 257]